LLLAVDIGNSHTVLAVFRGERLLHHWRLPSERTATADGLAVTLRGLLDHGGIPLRAIEGVVLASVVPPLKGTWVQLTSAYLACPLVALGPGIATGLTLEVDHPEELGADRVADCVAAWRLYGAPVVVVDCGTATKVEAVASGGRYIGGMIAPGVGVSSEALFSRAALLHRVDLVAPRRALGKSTAEQVQAGVIFGSAGQIDALVERACAEMGGAEQVIATGGFAELVAPASRTITRVDPYLTLQGLRLIYEGQSGRGGARP
jgi:type III pantothenate kinase